MSNDRLKLGSGQEDAMDTIFRMAHNLRRYHKAELQGLTEVECGIVLCEERLKKQGWGWFPEDGPTVRKVVASDQRVPDVPRILLEPKS